MEEMTLNQAIGIVQAFIIWGEKREGFDEAIERVCEYADNMSGYTGDKTRFKFQKETEAKIRAEYYKGKEDGILFCEKEIFRNEEWRIHNLKLDSTVKNCHELNFVLTGGEELHFEPVTKGYWETPEPDYDREGTRLPVRVAICSECQKPSHLPTTRFCPNCGSWNKDNGLDE